MTRFLIVNADDYGRTPGVSAGIRRAHLEGIVTTTTVMMNQPGVQDEMERARHHAPNLALGVHLNLTSGPPCAPLRSVSTLVGPDGLFHKPDVLLADPGVIDFRQVETEWRSQLEAFSQSGVILDHLDSHHHIVALRPDLWSLYLTLARQLHCGVRPSLPADPNPEPLVAGYPERVRQFALDEGPRVLRDSGVPHPAAFFASFYGPGATLGVLLALLRSLPEGASELMTHPGIADPPLVTGSPYAKEREDELAILTSGEVRRVIEESGVTLASYRGLWPDAG